jgi:hypothetical protein
MLTAKSAGATLAKPPTTIARAPVKGHPHSQGACQRHAINAAVILRIRDLFTRLLRSVGTFHALVGV